MDSSTDNTNKDLKYYFDLFFGLYDNISKFSNISVKEHFNSLNDITNGIEREIGTADIVNLSSKKKLITKYNADYNILSSKLIIDSTGIVKIDDYHELFEGKYDKQDIFIKQHIFNFRAFYIKIIEVESLIDNEIALRNKLIYKKSVKESEIEKPIISFKSTLTEPQLKTLFDELISDENKFISSDTTPEQFRAIFNTKPINTITPVKWIKASSKNKKILSKISLIDFIRILAEKEIVDTKYKDTENYKDLFQMLELCFFDGINNKVLKYTKSNDIGFYEYRNLLERIISSL